MIFLTQILLLIVAVQWCGEVKCKPLPRSHYFKTFHIGLVPLPPPPPPHFTLAWEKLTPFGSFEFKHSVKKRQIAPPELPPSILNEVIAGEDVPLKVPMTHLLERVEGTDEAKPAEVLITSVIEPLEPGKQISFLLPADSEVVITPAVKDVAPAVPIAFEAGSEPELKPEIVAPIPSVDVDITPKPLGIHPPPEAKPIENVILATPIESTLRPALPITIAKPTPAGNLAPVVQNLHPLVVSPVLSSVPIVPLLYTNINGIPLYTPASNVIPFITPAAVPIPGAGIPPSPLNVIKEIPPVVKEEIPIIVKEEKPVFVKEEIPIVIKEEVPIVVKEEIPAVVKQEPPPNFFVKSSRIVLYFGSMMLQMLSRFVNGQINFNQIPLPPPILGMK